MKKIATVVGARPQFIKSAPVSRAIARREALEEIVIHTGQHYDQNMSDIFFAEMHLKTPSYSLGIGSGTHGAQTGQMLSAIEAVLMSERPDVVLVYGDTNSTLAAALAAAKLHIKVAHVEAGLRSFNQKMPEEINRVLTDHVSEWLFCPTKTAVNNAKHEGLLAERIHLVGDVMYDAMLFYLPIALEKSDLMRKLELISKQFLLVTLHRAETTDNITILKELLDNLDRVAKTQPVILPLHPRTRNTIATAGLSQLIKHIRVIDPIGFLDMIALEYHAALIVTDSGGVQKEAYFQRVPCITVRNETEWVELIETGWNTLVPQDNFANLANIIAAKLGSMGTPEKLYGNGNAAEMIVEKIL